MAGKGAPRVPTLLLGVALTIVGALGTVADVLPSAVGVWSCVAATIVLMVGILFRRV